MVWFPSVVDKAVRMAGGPQLAVVRNPVLGDFLQQVVLEAGVEMIKANLNLNQKHFVLSTVFPSPLKRVKNQHLTSRLAIMLKTR